jgi:hypothetical protein
MFSSDPASTVPPASTSGTSAVAAEARPGGAAPVGTPTPPVLLSGAELSSSALGVAANRVAAPGTRMLVVLVRNRKASAPTQFDGR